MTGIHEYKIKTPAFEGPFPLLLELLEKRKLHVSDISLAEITDEYLKTIQSITRESVPNVSAFVAVAATLILLKSRAILPGFELSSEEEIEADELKRRVEALEKVRAFAAKITLIWDKAPLVAIEGIYIEQKIEFSPGEKLTLEILHKYLFEIFSLIPKKEFRPDVTVGRTMSIEEVFESLKERIEKAANFTFSSMANPKTAKTKDERVLVILSFLAMLEFVRQGILDAVQEEDGADISITKIPNS